MLSIYTGTPCLTRLPPEIKLYAPATKIAMLPSFSALIKTNINHRTTENQGCLTAGGPASRSTGRTH